MGKICRKCGYERTSVDSTPDYECPKCGAIYAKVDLHFLRQRLEDRRRPKEGQHANVNERKRAELEPTGERALCRECGKEINSEDSSCPHCGAQTPTLKDSRASVKEPGRGRGKRWAMYLGIVGAVGLVAALALPGKHSGRSGVATSPNPLTPGEQRILADIGTTRKNGAIGPAVLAEQEKFAKSALSALRCVQRMESCDVGLLEHYLKGLPVGWVEKALGQPNGQQRLSGDDMFYWTIRLDNEGRSETYKLQLQYVYGGGECPESVNGGRVACKFNFY